MSETDDTDELILIPPDFFVTTDDLEESYISGPYYNVVDSLITQVNELENRINVIEKSDGSIRSNSISYPINTISKVELMSNIRKYNSSDNVNKVTHDVYFESTQSTPQKPQTRVKLNSYSSTSTERYSPRKKNIFVASQSNQNKTNSREHVCEHNKEAAKEILQEIDQYICNVQENSRETPNKHKNTVKTETFSKNSLNFRDLDYMLQKVDLQTKDFNKHINVNKNTSKQIENNVSYFGDDGKHRKCDMRSKQIPLTSDMSAYNESLNEKTDSISSSSESTQLTTLPNMNRLQAGSDYDFEPVVTNKNYHEAVQQNYINYRTPTKQENQHRINIFGNVPVQEQISSKNDQRLLSLSHLWNHADIPDQYRTKEEKILHKLEEEKLRRQHCEQLIEHLQKKILELQEKLAVAVQVDEAKDDAILRFHSSWEQAAQRLQSLNDDRNELEHEISVMQTQNAQNMLEATKKINHFENEASKALALAETSQEKVKDLENHALELTAKIHLLSAKVEDLDAKYKNEVDINKNLLDQLEHKSMELNETNNSLVTVKNEIVNSKRAVELCQVELTSMRTQNSHLEMIITEKDDIIKSMERHNQKLLTENDTHKKIEKDLQQELNKSKESSEKNKVDLRNFYQDQVELVVREKLKEFQLQLDKAESSLQEDLRKRELTIARSAAGHIQQIADKHSLEVRLLEEKHGEEVRLYQVKLTQAQQYIESLQIKLDLQNQKKTDMAKQLHKVMEAQWLEALKIINNGKSPTISTDQDVTINQLNILKTKSHNNLEEVFSMSDRENDMKSESIIPPLNLAASTSSIQQDDFENYPFSLNFETPLTSRPKTKQEIEMELQKYVQMLVNKPGNPTDISKRLRDSGVQEIPTWQPPNLDDKSLPKKERRTKKPWK